MAKKIKKSINYIKSTEAENLYLGLLISNIRKYQSMNLNNLLKEYGIASGQIQFLLILSNEDHVTQEYLANLVNMNKGTVARTLKRLEKTEFIKRQTNEKDKREKIVVLRKKGKELIKEIERINENLETEILEDLSNKEIKILKNQLKNISLKLYNKNKEFKEENS